MEEFKRENQALNRRFEPTTRWVAVERQHILGVMAYMRTFGIVHGCLEQLDAMGRAHNKTLWFYAIDDGVPHVQEDHWEDICKAVTDGAGGLNKLRENYPALYEIVQPRQRHVIYGDRVFEIIAARFNRDMSEDG